MRPADPEDVTALLARWGGGSSDDRDRLFAAVHALEALDARRAEIAVLRDFGGLTEEEVVKVQGGW